MTLTMAIPSAYGNPLYALEKHPENYLALVKLAAAKLWMRFMS